MFAGLIHDDVLRTPVLFLLLRFHRLVIPGNGNLWLLATEPVSDEDIGLALITVVAVRTEQNPVSRPAKSSETHQSPVRW